LEAEAEFREALAIWQKMADDHPKSPEYRANMASGLSGLSDLLRRLGRTAEARDAAERAVALSEPLLREHPSIPTFATDLASSLHSRAMARLVLGDPARATADARRALAIWDGLATREGSHWFETARCHATLSTLSGRDGSGMPDPDGPAQAVRAIDSLRKAVGMGYRSMQTYRTDDALDPLRARDDFRLLMMDLAMPADPFSRDTAADR
jgi:hypothetical protein